MLVVQNGGIRSPMALRPDGELLASGSNGVTSIFSVRTGRVVASLETGEVAQTDVGWSPDGKLLLAADCAGAVTLWEVPSQRVRAVLKGHGQSAFVAFHPSSPVAASTGCEGRTFLWNTSTGQLLHELKVQSGKGLAVAFWGDWLAVRTTRTLTLWDWHTGHQLGSRSMPMEIGNFWSDPIQPLSRLTFDPSGRWLALADGTPGYGGCGSLRLLRVPVLETQDVRECYGPDCFLDGNAFLYNDREGRLRRLVPGSQEVALPHVATDFTLAAGRVVLLNAEHIKIRDLHSQGDFPEPTGTATWIRHVDWCTKGPIFQTINETLLATEGSLSHLRLLDHQGDWFFELPEPRARGSWLALPSRFLELLNLETGQRCRIADLNDKSFPTMTTVASQSWSPDGTMLAVELAKSPASSHIQREPPPLLLVREGRIVARALPPTRSSEGYQFSNLRWFGFAPDGRLVGLIDDNLCEFALDLTPRKSLGNLERELGELEFAPHQLAAAAGTDVRLWSYPSLAPRPSLKGHQGNVHCLAFSPDEQFLATGDDRSVRIWNLGTGRQIALLPHSGSVWSVAFSPDGQTLLTCSDTVHMWDVASGEALGTLTLMDNRRWLVVSPQGWWDGSAGIEKESDFRLGSRVYPVANLHRRKGLFEEIVHGKRPEKAPPASLTAPVEL